MYERLSPVPRTVITVLCIIISLAAATFAQQMFISMVQAPACFAYARQNNLADVDNLQLREVSISSGRNPHHACIFTHVSTGQQVILEYAREDVPATTDNLQVMSMVVSFLCASLISFVGLAGLWFRLTAPRKKPVSASD